FSDHLFYSPGDDYRYAFPETATSLPAEIRRGQLRLDHAGLPPEADTLVLMVTIRSTWLGRWLDPHVLIHCDGAWDRQDFERGAGGRRYLNLSGCLAVLQDGSLQMRTRFCRLAPEARLYAFANPDYAQQSMMI